jgi:hypothetical protein
MQPITTLFVDQGLPSFIRACLYEASRPGGYGYEAAGYRLGRALDSEVPLNAEIDEWDKELSHVDGFLQDDEQLGTWLVSTYPRILSRVPSKRRAAFVAGVRRGRLEETGD